MPDTLLPPNPQPTAHTSSIFEPPTYMSSGLLQPLPAEGPTKRARDPRVCYFFDTDIGNFHYGTGHPMKPTRIRMAHSLVMNYGLYKHMEIFRAKPATKREMSQFHTDEYVEFLYRVTPNLVSNYGKEVNKYNIGDDCPLFDGLFDYCSISAGGSMEGAARLSRDKCDIAVNWAGGLHHAKKCEASGFCYVNDIVLGILELLRYHQRVLYIDIDVHHGDGVEEAFLTTDRVMTCSFHKYGEFFPGTGDISDVGVGKGKYYAVNFPLRDGITDDNYKLVFEPTITKIMETFAPGAVVLQCGSDSLAGDRIGPFNLSMRGHANCVKFVKSFGLPMLMVGGGGYTIRNVSRTWAYETGIAAGQEMNPQIPVSEYYEYFGPDYHLDVLANNMPNRNTPASLQRTKEIVFRHLKELPPVPSVQMHHPPDRFHLDEDGEEVSLEERDKIDREMAEDRAAAQGRRLARRPLMRDDHEGLRPLDESDDEDDMRGDPGRRDRTDAPAAPPAEPAQADPAPEPAPSDAPPAPAEESANGASANADANAGANEDANANGATPIANGDSHGSPVPNGTTAQNGAGQTDGDVEMFEA